MKNRKAANLEIMNRLSEYLTYNSTMRFGQALRNIGVIVDYTDPVNVGQPRWYNHFNEEPWDMLKRMDEIKKEGQNG